MADELPITETDTDPGLDSPAVDGSEGSGEPDDGDSAQGETAADPEAVASPDADEPDGNVRVVSDAALASCALVEAGFIAALDGDSGSAELLTRGADSALGAETDPYPELGQALIDELGAGDGRTAADRFLNQCATDGFERLAG